jgi:exodeoxyribonuclease VII small subunit
LTEPEITLEMRMERLDAIVARLEGEDLELDEALALFEEGVAHIREAERKLTDAQLRIERLVAGPGGAVETEPVRGESD